MAEVIGIIGSTIAIANSAATLSRALFDVVESIKNARKEIAYLAQQLSFLSGSLHMLADTITSQQELYKPALYKNTNSILNQYRLVDGELRKLLETPRTLARLTWCIKRTKVRSLLREIEAIKTLLTLELNIIQLAKEELRRPPPDYNASNSATPLPNRFRKLVESAVQANRQVVESAQRDDAQDTVQKHGQRRAELDVYREGSFDTATWLYHLVFSQEGPLPPADTSGEASRPYQASVSEEGELGIAICGHKPDKPSSARTTSDDPNHRDRAMIVWSVKTEPSRVVDRLLSSWTTLTDNQIRLSATRHSDEDWRESFLKRVEGVKESEMDFDRWEAEWSSNDTDDDGYESADDVDVYEVPPSYRKDRPVSQKESSTAFSEEQRAAHTPQARTNKDTRTKRKVTSKQAHDNPDPWNFGTEPSRSRPVSRSRNEDEGFRIGDKKSSKKRADSRPSLESYHSARQRSPHPFDVHLPPSTFIPTKQGNISERWNRPRFAAHGDAYANAPPRWPHLPQHLPQAQKAPAMVDPARHARLDSITQRLENALLDQKDAVHTSPQLDRIVDLLTAQQEQRIHSELGQAKEIAEVKMKAVLAARDQDDADIRRLEKLLVKQRDEQQEAEKAWRAERLAQDMKAAEQADKAKALSQQEIEAIRSAEKATRKALKFEKREAEKRSKAEMEARIIKEKQDVEVKLNELTRHHEKALETMAVKQSQMQPNNGYPLRRTLVSQGNRSMEVTEYIGDDIVPYGGPNLSTAAFLREELFSPWSTPRQVKPDLCLSPSLQNPFQDSIYSLQAARAPSIVASCANPSPDDQQMIVLPSKLDQTSPGLSALKTSLARIGVDTTFQDGMSHYGDGWLSTQTSRQAVVHSSLFWEPPSLGCGSELLATYKRHGWKPQYMRVSNAGQTYFIGSQPVHSYFFRPDYTPPILRSDALSKMGSIHIDKALIHEYALTESGHPFESTPAGTYILDGRLQYSDIEALIERSFSMIETHLRAKYRRLHWLTAALDASSAAEHMRTETAVAAHARLFSTESVAESQTSCGDSEHRGEDDDDAASQRTYSPREGFQQTESEIGEVPCLQPDTSSDASASVAPWSSKSTNPFRRRSGERRQGKIDVVQGLNCVPNSISDDLML